MLSLSPVSILKAVWRHKALVGLFKQILSLRAARQDRKEADKTEWLLLKQPKASSPSLSATIWASSRSHARKPNKSDSGVAPALGPGPFSEEDRCSQVGESIAQAKQPWLICNLLERPLVPCKAFDDNNGM